MDAEALGVSYSKAMANGTGKAELSSGMVEHHVLAQALNLL